MADPRTHGQRFVIAETRPGPCWLVRRLRSQEGICMPDLDSTRNKIHRSPSLILLATVHIGLIIGAIASQSLLSGLPYPTPYDNVQQLQQYYTQFPQVMRIVSFLQFGASIPLGLFSVVIVSRLLFHDVRVAGVHIALFAGIASAVFLGSSGLATWTLAQPGVGTDVGAMRVGQLMAFATGAFGNVATLGLLLAGVCVPSLAFRLMPRWECWFGLFVAVVAEASVVSMLWPSVSFLLPLARFPALLWLIAASLTMPKTRILRNSDSSRYPLQRDHSA